MELSEFTSLLESPINGLLKSLGNELKQVAKNRLLEYQAIEFKRNYFTKTLLHRSEPIKLLDFYMPLQITRYANSKQLKGFELATDDISKLFKNSNYLTLIGNAGSGKSTIVKYLFINAVEKEFKIPIKIELRYLNDYESNLRDYIFNEIFLFYQLGFSTEIIERLLNSGAFVFFLDGYDEINSSKKESLTKDIDRFVSRFSSNCFLLTSRPYTNIDTLPMFSNYKVCDLLNEEIAAFVKKQIPKSDEELAEKIIKAIEQIELSSYKTFLSNPLLLSMFILTFQSYSEVPQKRSDFYKQVYETLYSVHDSVSKLSFAREKTSGLSKDGFEEVLRLFSFITYFEEKFMFRPDYLNMKLNSIKERKPNIVFDNEKLIEDLQVAIGIFNKEGVDFAFPHRSLQEYFAASYISNLSEQNKKIVLQKIREMIEKKWFYLFENSHFLILLEEQGYNSFLTQISIPLLKKEFESIGDIEDYDLLKWHDIRSKLSLIVHFLMQESIEKDSIHIELSRELRQTMFSRAGHGRKFVMIDIKKKKEIRDNVKFIKLFSAKGKKWIEDIEKRIQLEEKSDTDIIDII